MKLALFSLAAASLLVAGCSDTQDADTALGNEVATDEAVLDETASQAATESAMTVCDEAGNRYGSDAEAQAAGLDPAQYGATFCPEYLAAASGMHPSWDADGDGINDCEKDGTCDDSVDYSKPRE